MYIKKSKHLKNHILLCNNTLLFQNEIIVRFIIVSIFQIWPVFFMKQQEIACLGNIQKNQGGAYQQARDYRNPVEHEPVHPVFPEEVYKGHHFQRSGETNKGIEPDLLGEVDKGAGEG